MREKRQLKAIFCFISGLNKEYFSCLNLVLSLLYKCTSI